MEDKSDALRLDLTKDLRDASLQLIHLLFAQASSEMVSMEGWLSRSQEGKQGEKAEVY